MYLGVQCKHSNTSVLVNEILQRKTDLKEIHRHLHSLYIRTITDVPTDFIG